MKRRSTKTVQESADNWKCSRRTAVSTTTSTAITTGRSTTTTTTTSQAASSADVTAAPAAAPAGSARQRRFAAKRALEMLQSLPDTDSGSDDSETNDERSDSSVQLSAASSQDDDDDDVDSQTDSESTSRTTVTVPPTKATTDTDGQTTAKDGTKWKVVTQTALTGRHGQTRSNSLCSHSRPFSGRFQTAHRRMNAAPHQALHCGVRSNKAAKLGHD